ncbi:MAG: glycosyltransferase [Ignavibacteria bacterium]|nr:glycosyltransferase [Ignavibacteria bacterium]
MQGRKYKISIVTICFNDLKELKRTCVSVDSQRQKPDEHLIINASTKPDIDYYLRATKLPEYRRWENIKDEHISASFNEGILRSRGDIIHLLNAGDEYYDDSVIERVSNEFEKDDKLMWTHGNYVQYRGGIWVLTGKAFNPEKLYRGISTIGHPTMFVKREMYNKHGLFDKNKRVAMDFDFIVRIADERFKYIDFPITKFYPGGTSSAKQALGKKEEKESYIKYRGISLKMQLWFMRSRLLDIVTNTKLGGFIFQFKNKRKVIKE